jgi:16S rRNA (guanine966-N2)-methyltransferase
MRVIGGRSRGRRLAAKLPRSVRPTSDRVRESIFDILGSQGGVEGLDVVDLFCGSGALGLEALSRGAASATFVDQDADALAAVRQNLHAVGLDTETVTLVRAALPEWLQVARADHAFDLALCDPPYDFDGWPVLLDALRAGRVVMESSAPIALGEDWVVIRERRYGGTLVTVAHRNGTGS